MNEYERKPAKFCPLLSISDPDNMCFCEEDRCAWWDGAEQRCVLHAIGKALDDIAYEISIAR